MRGRVNLTTMLVLDRGTSKGLHSGSRSTRDKTSGAGGHFPNWRDCDKTTYVWSHCSENFGKSLRKIRDLAGLLSTTWSKS